MSKCVIAIRRSTIFNTKIAEMKSAKPLQQGSQAANTEYNVYVHGGQKNDDVCTTAKIAAVWYEKMFDDHENDSKTRYWKNT